MPLEPAESISHRTGRKLDYVIIGALVLALGYFAYDKFLLAPQRDAALVESTTRAFEKQAAAATGRTPDGVPYVLTRAPPVTTLRG